MNTLQRWLRLWFTFDPPVDRRTYFTHGLALTALKYGVDALVMTLVTHRFWTPLDYLNPLLTARTQRLHDAPDGVLLALMLWTLPFLWIGVSMTLRRARDAGHSPWWLLFFFAPVLNLAFMLVLSLLPSRPEGFADDPPPAAVSGGVLRSALFATLASLAVALALTVLNTVVMRSYAPSLFVATPFATGALAGFVFNRRAMHSLAETFGVATLAMALTGGALILFALEGAVCIAMALPIALPIALFGAVIGRIIAQHGSGRPLASAASWLALPAAALLGPVTPPAPRELMTAVVVNAPPARVWEHVVSFSELDEPPRWFFRLGIAYPRRAQIAGTGVGAIRHCEFSTGAFVEPITAWEEPTRLAFDVVAQPPTMHEWSPYRSLTPPHLVDYTFRSVRGEFRLVPLPGGRTRLEGRTWYVLDMGPRAYWTLWGDGIVHAIHARVLAHVKQLSEGEGS